MGPSKRPAAARRPAGLSSLLKPLFLALGAAVVLPWDVALIPGPMPRVNPQTEHTQPLDTPQFARQTLRFPSVDGVECEGWLYTPKDPVMAPPPVVVMAHGLVRACAAQHPKSAAATLDPGRCLMPGRQLPRY
jgi:hypothetical protein